jgi:hypothetical protein
MPNQNHVIRVFNADEVLTVIGGQEFARFDSIQVDTDVINPSSMRGHIVFAYNGFAVGTYVFDVSGSRGKAHAKGLLALPKYTELK